MSLHPAVVHIPIGLLLAYSATELFTIHAKRKEWTFVKSFLLILGVIGALAAAITGFIAAQNVTDSIVDIHEVFAFLTIGVYGLLAAAYATRKKNLPELITTLRSFVLRTPVKVTLAIIGAILIVITGSLGSIMSHGPSNVISNIMYVVFVE